MKRIELESIKDLIYLASSSPFGATIQHFKDEAGNHIYFLFGGTREETFVFYVKGEEIKKRFINFDISKNRIEYSDTPILDPKTKVTLIVEVKAQELLKELL